MHKISGRALFATAFRSARDFSASKGLKSGRSRRARPLRRPKRNGRSLPVGPATTRGEGTSAAADKLAPSPGLLTFQPPRGIKLNIIATSGGAPLNFDYIDEMGFGPARDPLRARLISLAGRLVAAPAGEAFNLAAGGAKPSGRAQPPVDTRRRTGATPASPQTKLKLRPNPGSGC